MPYHYHTILTLPLRMPQPARPLSKHERSLLDRFWRETLLASNIVYHYIL